MTTTRPTDDDLAQWKRVAEERIADPDARRGLRGVSRQTIALIAEVEALRAGRDAAQRAAQTLGKVVEDQCRDIARITSSEDMIPEDGDADWSAIWERGYDLAERAEKAEAQRDAALARIEKVRDVHYPAHNDQGRTPFCETCKGAPGVHECGCWQDEQEEPVCGHCRGWKGVGPINWPCPTIRALDGGEEGA